GALPNGDGVTFRVWAPHAREVRVIGDAPGWGAYEGARMRPGPSGIWEVTLTGAAPGQRYKYRVHGHDGRWMDRADPMAVAAEVPPATASVIHRSTHEWTDTEWVRARPGRAVHRDPLSAYE